MGHRHFRGDLRRLLRLERSIAQAGWGGMLVAAIVVYLMYVLMLNSISEMASAMPHTGGAYSFARAAMGPWGGFFTGLAETIEYVMTAATIVYFSSAYADAILSNLTGYSLDDHGLAWVWWLALYAIFVVVNWLGAETSFRFAEVVSIAALAIVALFGIGAFATGKADFSTLLNITPTEATPRSCRSARCHLLRHAVRHVGCSLVLSSLPLAGRGSA